MGATSDSAATIATGVPMSDAVTIIADRLRAEGHDDDTMLRVNLLGEGGITIAVGQPEDDNDLPTPLGQVAVAFDAAALHNADEGHHGA